MDELGGLVGRNFSKEIEALKPMKPVPPPIPVIPNYEGERNENHQKHGKGNYTCPDGYSYVGDWFEDEMHGVGTET